ncbi:MAG: hypothetical protein HND48_24970 [Chloroflexi bacterium]|nr:hypothetical protein [Chloroflexota bacterium]
MHRFIILNEPDIDRETYSFEFEGELEDYFNILKTAYLAARQGNPAARVHLAGTTYWHDINAGRRLYLDRLFERIMADPDAPANGYYFDALSLHIYFRSESIPFVVGKMQELLDRYGLGDKPIWINEYNTSPNLDPAWPVTRPAVSGELGAAAGVSRAGNGAGAGERRAADVGVQAVGSERRAGDRDVRPADAGARRPSAAAGFITRTAR